MIAAAILLCFKLSLFDFVAKMLLRSPEHAVSGLLEQFVVRFNVLQFDFHIQVYFVHALL